MKKYYNVLSTPLLEEIQQERNSLYASQVWRNSQLYWPENSKVGITGDCSVTFASENLAAKIREELKNLLPAHREFMCQHYVWKENAGISWHYDSQKFGLTIYLNPTWEVDYGGLFVWFSGEELKASCPEFNSAILNDENEGHLVTAVTKAANAPRHTLQIWGFE